MESGATRVDPSAKPADGTLGGIAKRTFVAWEKLRIWYVGILGVQTILLVVLAKGLWFDRQFWMMVIEGAIAANLCFFAGPILETYVNWLGYPTKFLRWFLLIAGTCFSCLLVFIALAFSAMQMSN